MKEKKRILLLGNCYYVIFRFRKEIIQELIDVGYEVWTAFPNGSHGEKERGEITADEMGCHFIELQIDRRGKKLLEEFKLIFRIWKLYKKIKPNVVLTYTVKPNIYGGIIAKIMKIPYIVNVTGLGSALDNKGIMPCFLLQLYKYSLNFAKKVFMQNYSDLDFFRDSGYTVDNIQMLPGSGVNLKEYEILPYPDKKRKVCFLYMARIMKEKGINEYLAAAKFYAKDINVEFHICGDCEEDYFDEINNLNQKGIIIYHGQVSDVIKYLRLCDCFVMPSYYHEGISNSLLEAAACGRPIITTNHPGCRETVEDKISGFIVTPRDTEDLINKISLFLTLSYEKRVDMGMAGRKKAEQQFDRQIVVDAYVKNIEQIISEVR